jgi:diaminohydroxyphosphoribosylaminopyrimidine deaminase/5-amino-6-(5-phosphoribosylamino)uracil reductase
LDARLFLSGDPVVLFHSGSASSEKIRLLEKKCCLVEVEGCTASGLNSRQVLGKLGEMKLTSLLIEGGSQVATSAVEARVVRRISFFYGSRLLGSGGLPGIGEIGVTELATAKKLGNVRLRKLGDDFLVEADIVG